MSARFGITAAGLVWLWGAHAAHAQSKVGTTTAQFLSIEPSARTAGMGNAGAALNQGIESVYFNPGAIGVLRQPSFTFTHAFWFADISYDYVAGALPLPKWGTLFASLTSLSSGDIDVRTVEQPLGTGERYSVSELAIGLGYGMRVSERFNAGLQVNYVRERIWHTTEDLFTFSLGTVYRIHESGLAIGSALSNLGTSGRYEGRDLAIQYDPDPDVYGNNSALPAFQWTDDYTVPLSFLIGLSYPWRVDERNHFLFVLDAMHPSDNAERVNFGAEWSYREVFALRAGWQTLFQDESELGPTFGAGLKNNFGMTDREFRIDYGWADHDRLEETHRISLVLDL
jgi:hypothetical protein